MRQAALAFAVVLAPLAAAAQDASQDSPPPAVTVVPVEERDVTLYREFVGRVEAIESVGVRARVSGFLEEVAFEEGALVEQGQLLYRIEPDQYEARLRAAEADLEGARAELRDAERDRARDQRLVERNTVSEARLDESIARAERAEASVLVAEADVQMAELDLGYTRIVSPIDGKIGATSYTLGNFVELSSGVLADIVQLDPIRVVFSMSETEYADLQQRFADRRGEAFERTFSPRLRLANGATYEEAGEIAFIGNQVDPSTGTIPFRARFDNDGDLLLPGQFVTVVVQVGEERRQPSVPLAAVQRDREGTYVFVVDEDDTAEMRRLALGRNFGEGYAVESGIGPGELVVVAGVQKLQDGMRVAPSRRDGEDGEAGDGRRAAAGSEAEATR